MSELEATKKSVRDALLERAPRGAKAASIDRILDAVAEISPELLQLAGEQAARSDEHGESSALLGQLVMQFQNATDDGTRIAMIDTISDLFADAVAGPVDPAMGRAIEAAKALLRKVMAGGFGGKAVSSAAARALAVSRDEAFLARVRTSLGSQNLAEVRLAACMLGFARDEASAPVLSELIVPQNMAIFDALIWSLGEIGSPVALPILHFVLETLMFTPEIVEALGKIGDESSLLPLLSTLVQSDEETRAAAAQAVVRVLRRNRGSISEDIATPTRAILEQVIDKDDYRLSRYFAIVAFALLGGELHQNRVLGALGAALPSKDLSPMSNYFLNRTGRP